MKKTKDLGTFHAMVELTDGRGWIQRWDTSLRFTHGMGDVSPLNATVIWPTWSSVKDLIDTMLYMYVGGGNYSCDCNKRMFLDRAKQKRKDVTLYKCGHTMKIKRINLVHPSGMIETIYDTRRKSCQKK